MKYSILLLVLFSFGCKRDGVDPDKNPEKLEKKLYRDAQIDGFTENSGLGGFYSIIKGDKLVFEFIYQYPDNKLIIDDELTEWFAFQMDKNMPEGLFINDEIYKLNPVYRYSCNCLNDFGTDKISGQMEIIKKNKTNWTVEVDLIFTLKKPEFTPDGNIKPLLSTFERKLNFKQTFKE